MALKRKVKAPKARWGLGTGGKGLRGGKLPSSTRKSKPTGISAANPHYGIVNTSKGDRSAKGNRLFGVTARPKSAQRSLAQKARREIG